MIAEPFRTFLIWKTNLGSGLQSHLGFIMTSDRHLSMENRKVVKSSHLPGNLMQRERRRPGLGLTRLSRRVYNPRRQLWPTRSGSSRPQAGGALPWSGWASVSDRRNRTLYAVVGILYVLVGAGAFHVPTIVHSRAIQTNARR